MRNGSVEQQTVDTVVQRIPGAKQLLATYRIDPSSRLSLGQAAAINGLVADEVLAVLEDRARRAARRARAAAPQVAQPFEAEYAEEELLAV